MKLSIPLLLLCLALTGCLRTPGKSGWSTATGAEEHERLMWQAIHDKKWNEVENHLAPTFVGVISSGQKFDRAGWIQYWQGQQSIDFSLGEVSVQPEGVGMVVTYEMHMSGTSNIPGIQVVSVWQQLKHGWVLIAQSLTPISK